MDAQSVKRLQAELNNFCAFLTEPANLKKYFAPTYEPPTQAYVDKAGR